jgi:hypothetical protein
MFIGLRSLKEKLREADVLHILCVEACRRQSYRKGKKYCVDGVWNVMAHAQKLDFVFRQNGQVHLNRQGRQFSRLLAGELCTSACRVCTAHASRVLQSCDAYWLPTPFACLTFTSPSVCHRVSSHFKRSLRVCRLTEKFNNVQWSSELQRSLCW